MDPEKNVLEEGTSTVAVELTQVEKLNELRKKYRNADLLCKYYYNNRNQLPQKVSITIFLTQFI